MYIVVLAHHHSKLVHSSDGSCVPLFAHVWHIDLMHEHMIGQKPNIPRQPENARYEYVKQDRHLCSGTKHRLLIPYLTGCNAVVEIRCLLGSGSLRTFSTQCRPIMAFENSHRPQISPPLFIAGKKFQSQIVKLSADIYVGRVSDQPHLPSNC
jgi:hypothetical protein